MDIRKLQRVIVDGLEDVKAQNISVFNTEHLSALFERVIIASGTSNRQTKSLASSVRDAVKKAGYPVPRTEGESNGEWIIIDCGAAVVHVMQPTIRDYYHLEEIWGDKPVSMKMAVGNTRLVKAAEPEAPAKRASARKASPASAGSKKAVARPAIDHDETPMRKAATKKASTVAEPVGKSTAKKTAAKNVVARKEVAKPGTARKPPATTPSAPKTLVVGKPPARKAAPTSRGVTRTVGVKSAAAKKAPVAAKKAPAVKKVVARKATSRLG